MTWVARHPHVRVLGNTEDRTTYTALERRYRTRSERAHRLGLQLRAKRWAHPRLVTLRSDAECHHG